MTKRIIIGSKKRKTYAAFSLDNGTVVGGTVKEFEWRGCPIIYRERKVEEKLRGGIPICFPYAGMPPERFGTQQHGWLRHQQLEIIDSAENSITLYGKNKPTENYPWQLAYTIVTSISPMGLKQKLTAERLSDGIDPLAPVNPMFHHYFKNCGRSIAIIGNERVLDFSKDAKINPVSRSIVIDSGRWLMRMELGGDFNKNSCVTLWSDNAKNYFCVEPVLTSPNMFNNTKGGKFLHVGQALKMICNIIPYAHYI